MSKKKVTDNERSLKILFVHLALAIGAGCTSYISTGFFQISFGFLSFILFWIAIDGFLNWKKAEEEVLIQENGLWTLAVLIVIALIMIYFNII